MWENSLVVYAKHVPKREKPGKTIYKIVNSTRKTPSYWKRIVAT
jgi:hypothetical protein